MPSTEVSSLLAREVSVDDVLGSLEDALEWVNERVQNVVLRAALVDRLTLRVVSTLPINISSSFSQADRKKLRASTSFILWHPFPRHSTHRRLLSFPISDLHRR